jgi:hypothetical protein
VVISTWDPLLPETRGFLRHLVEHGRANHVSIVAAVLDPAPQTYLRGASNWPVYTSFSARAHFMLAEGIDGVLRIDFQKEDLRLGVFDLLDIVRAHVRVAEVWTREGQTFGREARGSAMALAIYAKKHNLIWRHPPGPETKVVTNTVQHHLRRGEIAAAQEIVGLPPIWSRPDSDHFEVAWRPGTYMTAPATLGSSVSYDEPVAVELREQANGLVRTRWPALEIDHLRVLSGPGDTSWLPAAWSLGVQESAVSV